MNVFGVNHPLLWPEKKFAASKFGKLRPRLSGFEAFVREHTRKPLPSAEVVVRIPFLVGVLYPDYEMGEHYTWEEISGEARRCSSPGGKMRPTATIEPGRPPSRTRERCDRTSPVLHA